MLKDKRPSYPRYYKDYLSDYKVMAMTLEEEGMYNRLMDFCWDQGVIPNDPIFLSGMCKGKQPTELVLSCFIATRSEGDGNPTVLHHQKLDEIRRQLDEFKQLQSEAGKKGNKLRWGNTQKNRRLGRVSVPDRDPINSRSIPESRNVALQSSSSIASSSSNTPLPPNGGNGNGSEVWRIFESWNSHPELVHHQKLTKPMKDSVTARLASFGAGVLVDAIGRYAQVLGDKTGKYWLSQRWSLDEFMSRGEGKWIDKFRPPDWGINFLNRSKESNGNTASTQRHPDAFGSPPFDPSRIDKG